jgi:hypothetical protein
MFAAGGPVHGAGFGVLVGALGLAGLRTGELPRPLAIAGLVSATAGLLSPLYFVTDHAVWFIPGGRFSGLLVSGIAGTLLARRLRTSQEARLGVLHVLHLGSGNIADVLQPAGL